MSTPLPVVTVPPAFCEYAAGECDQSFDQNVMVEGTFLYPALPKTISSTIESAVDILRRQSRGIVWTTWKEHATTGQIVFCRICQAMRFAKYVIADVTTLNFNLMFEIGYALGLGKAVIPVRDTTVLTNAEVFSQLGMLDTLGYIDFQNSDGLATALLARLPVEPMFPKRPIVNREQPLYVVRAHIPTEGDTRLMSTLERSAVHARVFDVNETPRLSLQEAHRQVASSLAVLVHLMSRSRKGSDAHNARCAIIAGMALAMQKSVLVLEEEYSQQPIDYRDVVSSYSAIGDVGKIVEPLLLDVIDQLQRAGDPGRQAPSGFLESLDLGDVAAENETRGLRYYFVKTAQFSEAKRGMARLVVGRKGAGKTALFYGVRESVPRGHDHIVVDLKPEGHQFTKLREVVLSKLTVGFQEHTMTAFWNYILLCEIAEKIRDKEFGWAQRDPEREARFKRVMEVYSKQVPADVGDFSERLHRQVIRLTDRFEEVRSDESWTEGLPTELLFRGDIRTLDDALAPYLSSKDAVWILVDNLDKGWPTRGTKSEDILILRALLEATRKLQRQLSQRDVSLHALVFLRNDIYEHLLVETPDRGKDTSIVLEWDDEEVFRELIRQRVKASTGRNESFEEVWALVAEPFVGTEDSFRYLLSRTLMRPRDLLQFLQRAIGVAINRGHARVTGADIHKAEESYSEDMLLNTAFELRDVRPELRDTIYRFASRSADLSAGDVEAIVKETVRDDTDVARVTELLVWFGFLGVRERADARARYSYDVRYNIEKLMTPVRTGRGLFSIHPAFYKALGTVLQ